MAREMAARAAGSAGAAPVRMKFFPDTRRCIECGGCEVACKNVNNVPPGIFRIRVLTVNEGEPGETNVPVPCMHCTDAPCVAVCPVDALFARVDGIVQVNKETCIGCGYCLYACPFGAPQFPKSSVLFGSRGVMDKCTYCSGGPVAAHSDKERRLYGSNRIAEGKLPACASFCATQALVAGDAEFVDAVVQERNAVRGPSTVWGWQQAYKQA